MLAPADPLLADSARAVLERCWPKPDVPAVCAALDELFGLVDATWDARRHSLAYLRSASPSACAAGCGWCCHQQVGVSTVEAVRIAAHLGALPAAERESLAERITAVDRSVRGLSTTERARARTACPFLGVDGCCRIYAVRPLRCRGLHSIDAAFCKACHDDSEGMRAKLERGELKPVFLDAPARIYDSGLDAVLTVLRRHAPKTVVALELVAAVAALLADPRLAARWLAARAPESTLHLRPE